MTAGSTSRSRAAESELESRTLDQSPASVVVVDNELIVRLANQQARRVIGFEDGSFVGRHLVEVVHPDDVAFAADLVDDGAGFDDVVLGPIRIRIRGVDGDYFMGEFLTRRLEDGTGWILVGSELSTSAYLDEVASSIAGGAELDSTMEQLVRACESNPICSDAAIVMVERAGVRPATAWPLVDFDAENVGEIVEHAVRTRQATSFESADGDDHFSAAARHAGVITIWTHPITEQGDVVAVLVILRAMTGPPTANQDRHLDRLISTAELAFSQSSYRRSLEVAATTDPLTGLANRASLGRFDAPDESFGPAIYIDLDGFKAVNDSIGHAAGDSVLRIAAQRIVSAVNADDHVVRIGGDEFVVITSHGDSATATSIAKRIVDVLGRPYEIDDEHEPITTVTASVGVSCGHDSVDEALRRADEALMLAKTEGKNRAILIDAE